MRYRDGCEVRAGDLVELVKITGSWVTGSWVPDAGNVFLVSSYYYGRSGYGLVIDALETGDRHRIHYAENLILLQRCGSDDAL